ncbi:PhoU domain-containing protein [Fusobacterium varium]|uniref:phosphate signaling complex PhoU family protein n=1 Tax=Fusobacterium varium TaxID=856 RepID=UPI002FF066EF
MKNLQESLEGLNQHYLELLKNLNRVLDVNIEMLYNQKLDSALYGECVVVEDVINAFEVKLKEDSIISIARFQPAAGNLRLLIMLINSARLLERMGDLLKANFKIIKDIEKTSPQVSKYLKEILYPMVVKIKVIYETYISAFINSDEKALYLLLTKDEEIDEIAEKNMKILMDLMKASPDNIEGGTYLVLLNKKYERFSDHVMHLVVDLVYILKGENLRKLELLEEKKIKK